ncbi:MAG: prenyltransferase/squalene oxidase repeat-containing protein [Oscillospiraceae bacterium]
MKVWKRTLPAWLLILVMLLTACGTPSQSAQPDSTEGWRKVYEETGAYLQAQAAPSVGSIGGEWAVIGLSRAGLLSDAAAQSYEQAAEDYVKQAGSVRLHHAKSTENSRTILGLTAAGYDAANVAGVDLTAGLTDMAYLRAQGTNGPIWALIALDCHGYDIPQCADGEEQVTREGLVAEILSYQCSDGGWALMGDESDVDMTAMALTALAPYKDDVEVKAAVDAALAYLSDAQQDDGGFMGWGTANSESCAQVIVALTALGIDPAADSRFVKNGASPLDGLCAFACEGGGFCHSNEQAEPDGMATEQGFYALAAYDRFRQGMTSLFDMTDIKVK